MPRRSPLPIQVFIFAFCALAFIWSCRVGDLVDGWQQQRVATVIAEINTQTLAATLTEQAEGETATEEAPPEESPTAENVPDETLTEEPSPTEALPATETVTQTPTASSTAVPTGTSVPSPTRTSPPSATPTPVTPTSTPLPTRTFTPAWSPTPTHCPRQYCVTLTDCKPGNNTRAIGTVRENGVPKNEVRVRVSYSDGGPPVVPDFYSGHDPINPTVLDPNHPGYYQIGILEGGARDGYWWVFLIDSKERVISQARWFKTEDLVTGNSCQVGITDFNK